MRLLVRMVVPKPLTRQDMRNRRFVRNWAPNHSETFETTVVRLIGPVRTGEGARIYADGFMPEKYQKHAVKGDYQPDGSYRFEVMVNHNSKTLAPFLASGLEEMDVTEVE